MVVGKLLSLVMLGSVVSIGQLNRMISVRPPVTITERTVRAVLNGLSVLLLSLPLLCHTYEIEPPAVSDVHDE